MVICKGDPTLHIRQMKTKFKMPFIRRGEKKTWYLKIYLKTRTCKKVDMKVYIYQNFFGNKQLN